MFWSYVYNLPTGAVASYWQLMSLYVSVGNGQAIAKIRGYVDEAAFLDGKSALLEQEYAFIQSDNAIALWADLDLSGINADLESLGPDFDIDMLGIHNFTLDLAEKSFDPSLDDDETEEKSAKTCPHCGEKL